MTFVVGTGRSGSTMLSRILNRHPEILSVNELLTSLGDRALPAGPLTGGQFWELLSAPNPLLDGLIRGGARAPELIYPAEARYTAETTGVPAICLTVLPHLTADPDTLFDDLGAEISRWPSRPAADHYRGFFGELRRRFGGRVTVERSGHSLEWVTSLRKAFPEARFVHMYRDGADVAVSMSRHAAFQLIHALREILQRTGVPSVAHVTPGHLETLPPELRGLFTRRIDHAALMDRKVPPSRFGQMWSELIRNGVAALDQLPSDIRTGLRYERLLQQPRAELGRIADFLGVDTPEDWLAWACASLDHTRRGRASRLAAQELAEVRAACAPGEECLDGAE